jgi:tetratricopeptide (TPR) repeat protein
VALLNYAQGRYAEAEPLFKRALAIMEKALRPDHPDVANFLNNLASLYQAQRRYAEAEPLYKRSLAIVEKALGAEHPNVAASFYNLAWLGVAQGEWAKAADYWRLATKLIERRAERGLPESEEGSMTGDEVRNGSYFSSLVKMTDQLVPQGHTHRAERGRQMFETAQWAQASEAASSLAQMGFPQR